MKINRSAYGSWPWFAFECLAIFMASMAVILTTAHLLTI